VLPDTPLIFSQQMSAIFSSRRSNKHSVVEKEKRVALCSFFYKFLLKRPVRRWLVAAQGAH